MLPPIAPLDLPCAPFSDAELQTIRARAARRARAGLLRSRRNNNPLSAAAQLQRRRDEQRRQEQQLREQAQRQRQLDRERRLEERRREQAERREQRRQEAAVARANGPLHNVARRDGGINQDVLARLPSVQSTPGQPDYGRHVLGAMDRACSFCGALHFLEERLTSSSAASPRFGTCCYGGKVALPLLQPPPEPLHTLYTGNTADAKHFRSHARAYNSAFQLASTGATFERATGATNMRMCGRVYHRIGALRPADGQPLQFAQLYIHDTAEVRCTARYCCARCALLPPACCCSARRGACVSQDVLTLAHAGASQAAAARNRTVGDACLPHVLQRLQEMLHSCNPYAQDVCAAAQEDSQEVAIVIHGAGAAQRAAAVHSAVQRSRQRAVQRSQHAGTNYAARAQGGAARTTPPRPTSWPPSSLATTAGVRARSSSGAVVASCALSATATPPTCRCTSCCSFRMANQVWRRCSSGAPRSACARGARYSRAVPATCRMAPRAASCPIGWWH